MWVSVSFKPIHWYRHQLMKFEFSNPFYPFLTRSFTRSFTIPEDLWMLQFFLDLWMLQLKKKVVHEIFLQPVFLLSFRKAIAKSGLQHMIAQPPPALALRSDSEREIRSTVDWSVSAITSFWGRESKAWWLLSLMCSAACVLWPAWA